MNKFQKKKRKKEKHQTEERKEKCLESEMIKQVFFSQAFVDSSLYCWKPFTAISLSWKWMKRDYNVNQDKLD